MKFTALPVESFEDVTLDLEQLQAGFPNVLAGGSGTVTYPGSSAESNSMTVTHGLRRVPTSVVATSTSTSNHDFMVVSAVTATSFTVVAFSTGAPVNGAQSTFYWLAIG